MRKVIKQQEGEVRKKQEMRRIILKIRRFSSQWCCLNAFLFFCNHLQALNSNFQVLCTYLISRGLKTKICQTIISL